MVREEKKIQRVAIYTRKSVEDAEEKQFNSIDAQRKMCENFIAAKAAENWVAIPTHYDDYGFSGSRADNRPAFNRLIQDCKDGKVDRICCFKIDRLSRSPRDFADFDEKMKELSVDYVSVTENFVDTSTPMGRMIVSMILSFAQCEREQIQDRIRKHFATARAAGVYCGGRIPFGYRVENQMLVPNPETAKYVPYIFELYTKLGETKKMAAQLNAEGITWGKGQEWSTRTLYNFLRNPRYVGDARDADGNIIKGQHQPLVTRELWQQVQDQFKDCTRGPRPRRISADTNLLQGILKCGHCGQPMTYKWTKHNRLGTRRYGYYMCQHDAQRGVSTCPLRRVSSTVLETAVECELEKLLSFSSSLMLRVADDSKLGAQIFCTTLSQPGKLWTSLTTAERRRVYLSLLESVTVYDSSVDLRVKLCSSRLDFNLDDLGQVYSIEGQVLYVRLPVEFRTICGRKKVVTGDDLLDQTNSPDPQGTLVKAFARAYAWMRLFDQGEVSSISQLAQRVGIEQHYVRHVLRLATLSPRITRAVLNNRLPNGFSLGKIRKVHSDVWAEQERYLGFTDSL